MNWFTHKIKQLIIFATHSVITAEACPLGYLLLRSIRHFQLIDMYAALNVHTEDTITRGDETIQAFGRALEVSMLLWTLLTSANDIMLQRSISKKQKRTKILHQKAGNLSRRICRSTSLKMLSERERLGTTPQSRTKSYMDPSKMHIETKQISKMLRHRWLAGYFGCDDY